MQHASTQPGWRQSTGARRFGWALVAIGASIAAFSGIAAADAPDPKITPQTPTISIVSTVDNGDGTTTVTVKGGWVWTTHKTNCNVDRAGAGFAVDWNDPDDAGFHVTTLNGDSIDVGSVGNTNNPVDNVVHPTPTANNTNGEVDITDPTQYAQWRSGCGTQTYVDANDGNKLKPQGIWGPIDGSAGISHVYSNATLRDGDVRICSIMYDVHGTDQNDPSGETAGGPPNAAKQVTAGGANRNTDNGAEDNAATPVGNACAAVVLPRQSSLTITKVLQLADGTEQVADASTPVTFDVTLDPTPTGGQPLPQATGADGTAVFVWSPADLVTPTDASVEEQVPTGFVPNGAECTIDHNDGADPVPVAGLAKGVNEEGASTTDTFAVPGIHEGDAAACTVYDRQLRASISVDKVTVPADQPDGFTFDLNTVPGGDQVSSLTDVKDADGVVPFGGSLTQGTYAVVEQPTLGYEQTSASCDDTSTQVDEAVSPDSIEANEGQTWVCTFVNTLSDVPQSSVSVTKVLQLADGTEHVADASTPVTFDLALDPAPQSGQPDSQVTGADGTAVFVWAPDTAQTSTSSTLTEVVPGGFVPNGAECTVDHNDGSDPVAVEGLSKGDNEVGSSSLASFDLPGIVGGESISCTVYNRQLRASIGVDKTTDPANDPQGFSFDLNDSPSGDQAAVLDDVKDADGVVTFADVPEGKYEVVEHAVDGWDQTSSSCDDTTTAADEAVDADSIDAHEGQTWVCTFVNTKAVVEASTTTPTTSTTPETPATVEAASLPRTGQDTRLPLLMAGIALLLGGLVLAGGGSVPSASLARRRS